MGFADDIGLGLNPLSQVTPAAVIAPAEQPRPLRPPSRMRRGPVGLLASGGYVAASAGLAVEESEGEGN